MNLNAWIRKLPVWQLVVVVGRSRLAVLVFKLKNKLIFFPVPVELLMESVSSALFYLAQKSLQTHYLIRHVQAQLFNMLFGPLDPFLISSPRKILRCVSWDRSKCYYNHLVHKIVNDGF